MGSVILVLVVFIGIPIFLSSIVLILGIRDGLKNGFPKHTGGGNDYGINPATGLPMMNGIDIDGNPSGTGGSHFNDWEH